MKAEEEEVDIDTVVTGAEAAVLGAKGTQSGNKGGAATPVRNGHSHAMDIDKLGSVGLGDDAVDAETAWAEEDPDGDTLGGWKMKVIMEDEAADYY